MTALLRRYTGVYFDGDDGSGSGGAPPEGGTGGQGGSGGSGSEGGPATKTFSQEDVTAIAAREKDQGKRAAQEEISKRLGVPIEEAERLLKEMRKRADDEKSEAQRAREAADAEKAEAEREKQAAAQERHDARVERALLASGITDEAKVKRVGRLLDVEVGAEPDVIKAAVTTLKKDMPELFGEAPGGKKPPASDPNGKPPTGKSGDESALERGMKRGVATGSRGGDGSGVGGYDIKVPGT